MSAIRRRAAVTVAVLGVTAWALWRTGQVLGVPAVRSWVDASRWYELVGPAVAVMAVVRVAAMAVAVWLLAAATLQLLATVLPGPSVRSVADVIAPRSLQRLVHGLAGVSLAAGLGVAAPGADPSPGAGTATLHVVPDPVPATAPAPAAPPVVTPDVVVVEAGDSLWSIAENALIDAGDASPTDAAVTSYWRRLIEANRGVLVEPTNPDLIYPGQVITLPAP